MQSGDKRYFANIDKFIAWFERLKSFDLNDLGEI